MLPLWIIDVTGKSDRREAFQCLLRKIRHVKFCDAMETEQEVSESNDLHPASPDQPQKREKAQQLSPNSNRSTDTAPDKTTKEFVEEAEREEAARNAIIKGNYWLYSSYDYDEYFTQPDDNEQGDTLVFDKKIESGDNVQTSDAEPAVEEKAHRLYKFQERLVKDAKKFVDELRYSNAKPYQAINIVVLGDVSEAFTRLVYSAIAAILQKEKGRFLASHIHQGLRIIGMLYVPCDINTYCVEDRQKILRLFREIEVQHKITSVRGYDHIMFYEDVQNRTECTYTRLDARGQAEYLLQCLVHMYLACDINHPLIHGTGSVDTFYFSMGASSIYFDMSYEDEKDANHVASRIVQVFKEEAENDKTDLGEKLVKDELYKADTFIRQFVIEPIDLDEDEPSPNPHPIWNYFHRNLKRFYYQYHLRYCLVELKRDILQRIDQVTSDQLDKVSAYCSTAFKSVEIAIPPAIKRVISKTDEYSGGLVYIEYLFKDFEQKLSKEKTDLRQAMERWYWQKILSDDLNFISKRMLGQFEEYHDTYVEDIRAKNGGAGCHSMKDEVMNNLQGLLSKEKTLMSTLVRSFLFGIILVLSVVPVLDFISPLLIDLGNVSDHAFAWGTCVFLLPVLYQLIAYYFYRRKKSSLINKLKAYFTHDAHARIANRIESEAIEYYDKVIALCEAYLVRCKRIRNEVSIKTPLPEFETTIPRTRFNQPLNGGEFADVELIPEEEIESSRIKVNYEPQYVSELNKSKYFLLIHFFQDEMSILFRDVVLTNGIYREFNEENGNYDFVGPDEQKRRNELQWDTNVRLFISELKDAIRGEMVRREHATVGEKLLQYKRRTGRLSLLEPMIAFAATNGEIISQADTEFADIKVNVNIEELSAQYLPIYTTRYQVSKYDELYKKYLFVTRWRCLDQVSFNRILPEEDFDQNARDTRVFDDEMRKKREQANNERKLKGLPPLEDSEDIDDDMTCQLKLSSIILWAVCPDDNSGEWLKLFDGRNFSKAYEVRKQFRKILNQND